MTEENKTVFVVFAKLDYSHTNVGPVGSTGTTSTILGIAATTEVADMMVTMDHLKTLADEGLNPLKHPLHLSEEGDGVLTLEGGSDSEGYWSNTITWTIQEVPLDELLDNFEI